MVKRDSVHILSVAVTEEMSIEIANMKGMRDYVRG